MDTAAGCKPSPWIARPFFQDGLGRNKKHRAACCHPPQKVKWQFLVTGECSP